MSTATRSGTETTTISAQDVRKVMVSVTEEITAICNAMARVACDFDKDAAMVDCSVLALNDAISAIHLQVYSDGELVREYSYVIADRPLEAWGPPADQPPVGSTPDGARVRLVGMPNPRQPREYVDGWFARLGWIPAAPLLCPEGLHAEAYGAFASGGYGIERRLLVNPKYDRPINMPQGHFTRKER